MDAHYAEKGTALEHYEIIATELVRAIRGSRSQSAFSRDCGYKSNVVYLWESGRSWPTAARFFEIMERLERKPEEAIVKFYGLRPDWLDNDRITSPAGVATLLSDLSARTSYHDLHEMSGRSRYTISRWLRGLAQPKLPEFLMMVDMVSRRLLDFVSTFVDPAEIPALADEWRRLQGARRLAYQRPVSHGVLRLLEVEDYRTRPNHDERWIAKTLGIPIAEVEAVLSELEIANQIEKVGGKWRPSANNQTIDTRQNKAAALEFKMYWANYVTERLHGGAEGTFSLNLFCVSAEDMKRITEVQKDCYRQIRSIIAESEPAERVGVLVGQILDIQQPS